MDCSEVREKLHDVADAELSEEERRRVDAHLSHCAKCAKSFEGILGLKKLVRATTRRTPLPMALKERVRAVLDRAGRGGAKSYWWAAAAAVLVGLFLGVYLGVLGPDQQQAHAQVLRGCLQIFERILAEDLREARDGPQEDCVREDVQKLEQETSVSLDRIPLIPGACYCGATPYRCPIVPSVRGLRLDYLVKNVETGARRISIFVLPLDSLPVRQDILEELGISKDHYCPCVKGTDDTIYCTTTPSCLVNVVSDVEEELFKSSFKPEFAMR